jgi:hypothetical protein
MQWCLLSIRKERPIGNKLDPSVDSLCSRFWFFRADFGDRVQRAVISKTPMQPALLH